MVFGPTSARALMVCDHVKPLHSGAISGVAFSRVVRVDLSRTPRDQVLYQSPSHPSPPEPPGAPKVPRGKSGERCPAPFVVGSGLGPSWVRPDDERDGRGAAGWGHPTNSEGSLEPEEAAELLRVLGWPTESLEKLGAGSSVGSCGARAPENAFRRTA